MGWTTGSQLAQDLWNDLKKQLDLNQQVRAKKLIIKHFENYDCDTLDEVEW